MAKILLVDDDEGFLFLVREYLNAHSFEVDLASSARQARSCLEHSKYSAVVSDFNMPLESGLDLFRHIKGQFTELPFILVTGNHSLRLKREALKTGCSAFLEKPFQLRDLVETLKAVLSRANVIVDSAAKVGAKEYIPERGIETCIRRKGRRQKECA